MDGTVTARDASNIEHGAGPSTATASQHFAIVKRRTCTDPTGRRLTCPIRPICHPPLRAAALSTPSFPAERVRGGKFCTFCTWHGCAWPCARARGRTCAATASDSRRDRRPQGAPPTRGTWMSCQLPHGRKEPRPGGGLDWPVDADRGWGRASLLHQILSSDLPRAVSARLLRYAHACSSEATSRRFAFSWRQVQAVGSVEDGMYSFWCSGSQPWLYIDISEWYISCERMMTP